MIRWTKIKSQTNPPQPWGQEDLIKLKKSWEGKGRAWDLSEQQSLPLHLFFFPASQRALPFPIHHWALDQHALYQCPRQILRMNDTGGMDSRLMGWLLKKPLNSKVLQSLREASRRRRKAIAGAKGNSS